MVPAQPLREHVVQYSATAIHTDLVWALPCLRKARMSTANLRTVIGAYPSYCEGALSYSSRRSSRICRGAIVPAWMIVKTLEAICFVLRTGYQWKALHETGSCSRSAAHRRFPEWTEADVCFVLW